MFFIYLSFVYKNVLKKNRYKVKYYFIFTQTFFEMFNRFVTHLPVNILIEYNRN